MTSQLALVVGLALVGAGCNHQASSAVDGGGSDVTATDAGDAAVAKTPAEGMFGAYYLFPKDPSALTTANIDGAFVSFAWSKLQPTNAAPDFSSLDTWLDAAVSAHSRITIGIQAGASTPMWVYGNPVDPTQYLSLTEYAFQQQICQPNQIVPIPWQPGFLTAWTSLVDAFAAHVGSNPAWVGVLAGVKITGINNSTLETSLPYTSAQTHGNCVTTDAPKAWQAVGYTDDLVNGAWQTILGHFAAGFPNQALIMDYIDLGFPAEYVAGVLQPRNNAVSTLLTATATTMLGTKQFIIEGTGLAESSGAAPNMDNYVAAGGDVGFQELYYVDNAPPPCVMSDPMGATMNTCDKTVLHAALLYGISHHMRYVELYNEDIAGYPTEVEFAHDQLVP